MYHSLVQFTSPTPSHRENLLTVGSGRTGLERELTAPNPLCGHGVCAAPTWLVLHDLSQGRVERVLPPLPLFVTYPETRVPNKKVRRCVDWLSYSLQVDGLFL